MPSVLGFDTETTHGFPRLLACSNGTFVETSDTIELLDFLFEQGQGAEYNVFWNIRFDFGAIIKRWVCEQAPRLKAHHLRGIRIRQEVELLLAQRFVEGRISGEASRRKTELIDELKQLESVEHFDVGKYRLQYIPKKGFRITRTKKKKRGSNSVYFFDAMGWYSTGIGDATRLDTAAQKHLGRGKTDAAEELDTAILGGNVGWYYEAHRDAILRYCVEDCRLTAELFAKTIAGFEAIGYSFPSQPWSRASVGREILKHGSELNHIPAGLLEATRAAYQELDQCPERRFWTHAYCGACILCRGVGAWTDVSEWDINSAYPAAMPDFPSLDGAFLVGKDDPRFASCFFRFYEIDLIPTPRHATRDPNGDGDNLVYHSGGTEPRRCYVTSYDMELFDLWGDPYTVIDAVGIVTPSNATFPLEFMRTLYAKKDRVKTEFGKDSVEYQNAKIPLNGIYGILTQSRPRAGRYTNFIYGSYITAWTRREIWKLTQWAQGNGGTVLAWKTDGVFVSGLSSLPESSPKLGEWTVAHVGLVVLFANGVYYVPSEATPQWDGLKKRGAPHLTVGNLMDAERPYIHLTRNGPLGLKNGIIQGRPEQIGIFLDEEKDLTPADMLEEAGLRVTPDLRSAPLKDYFTRSWYLDHRTPDELKLPPRRLVVSEAE